MTGTLELEHNDSRARWITRVREGSRAPPPPSCPLRGLQCSRSPSDSCFFGVVMLDNPHKSRRGAASRRKRQGIDAQGLAPSGAYKHTLVNALRKARALITKGWTRGAYARNENGVPVPPGHPSAVCHCGDGALRAVADARTSLYKRARAVLDAAIGGVFPEVNDAPGTTKKDVLRAIDRAIRAVSR